MAELDEYNTAVRVILDGTFPDFELNEDWIVTIVEYCRRDNMLDADKPKWYYPLSEVREDAPTEFQQFSIMEVIVPHLYSILMDAQGGE